MPLAKDLLYPPPAEEKRKHKLKRLVPNPNSFFMDVKCPNCFKISLVFSNVGKEIKCDGCGTTLGWPTGGRTKLKDGCSYRKKPR